MSDRLLHGCSDGHITAVSGGFPAGVGINGSRGMRDGFTACSNTYTYMIYYARRQQDIQQSRQKHAIKRKEEHKTPKDKNIQR